MEVYVRPIYNINRFVLQECGGVTWRVSNCEELEEFLKEGEWGCR